MTYKNEFTLDGRIKPANHLVTPAKVAAADKLLGEALRGSDIANGQLREVHSSSDLKFNLAHLVTATVLPQFDAAERQWTKVAGVRTVPDFGPVRLMSLFGSLTGAGVNEKGGLNGVAEAANYPYVTITGQEAFYAKLGKMGAKFGFTWESNIQDVAGFFEQIPGELVQLALDTEEREVFEALVKGTTQELATQTLPDGTVIKPNAKISPDAIWGALIQLQNVEINGAKVGRSSNGYNVLVPAGTEEFIEYHLNRRVVAVQDGLYTFAPDDRSALAGVTVIGTTELTGESWIVLPKPGGLRRPVLELLRLRGYESPELRVNNDTGTYVGGSAVSPFEGSFDNDTIDYRIRFVAGGVLWSDKYSLKSDGSETA